MSQTPTLNDQPWIRPLPERLVNKIAAGEVVARPASVVKELVENAIDGRATQVDIEIERSGVKLIKIIDNGCGIGADQVEIAFSRHATSKIAQFKDLDRILSYGFRGEALPSIASVSRLRMVTRSALDQVGTEIVYEGGVLLSKTPCAAPQGTTIEVGDLFYNTPARRKFLKAETTEARHITRASIALAMGRPTVGFSYKLNGRKIYSLPADVDLGDRVSSLLAPGKKFIKIEGELGPVKLLAFVGPPDLAQRNRNSQYLFINHRLIQSPTLSHAFVAGYGELLPKGNFPIGALLLTVDPAEIDVNVHPAKTEVRLTQEREIRDGVYRLLKEGLQQGGVIPGFKMSHAEGHTSGSLGSSGFGSERSATDNRIPGMGSGRPVSQEQMTELYRAPDLPIGGNGPRIEAKVDLSTGEILDHKPQTEIVSDGGAFRLVGRFSDLYLLFQRDEELFVIDQHTAHERVLFEETLMSMDQQNAVGQRLLLPVQIELGPDLMTLYDEAEPMLNQSGFEVAHFGGSTVRIEAVPSILKGRSPEKALRSILDDIASLKKTGYEMKKAVAQSVACRSAVMSGDRLNDREAMGLIHALLKCENAYSCPHGRPTFIKISREDLDRQFGRS